MAEIAGYPILKDFISRISVKLGSNYRYGALFGSRARGTARQDSDYDVLVVTDFIDHRLKRDIIDIAYDEFLETGIDISPVVFSSSEYERQKLNGNPLLIEIERDMLKL
jgi:predicted nucleotidyltransferase